MQDSVGESETGGVGGPVSKTSNVFVLSTGRCGSVTFTRACSHITNYTSGHETRSRELGEQRLAYPARHIEADNRLSWFLGGLHARFGDEAVYVHLTRDAERVADSYNRRWTFHGSILMAFGRGVLKSRSGELDVARDYVRTVTENIAYFLADKSRVHHIDIDDPLHTFEAFWRDIGAEGDLDQALSEFTKRHNASVQAESETGGSDADWGHTVVKQLEASRDRLQADVRQLRQEILTLTRDNTKLQKALHKAKSSTVSSHEPSVHTAKGSKIIMQKSPRTSFMNVSFAKQRKKLKTIRKWLKKWRRRKTLPFQNLKFDEEDCHRSAIDLKSKWQQIVKVQPYEAMLWSFYEEHAVTRFERIARDRQSVGDLVQANWALARWHWSKGRFEKALALLRELRRSLPEATWPEDFLSFEARTLSHLARPEEAIGLMSGDSAQRRLNRFAILRQADHDADACLSLLNAVYRDKNLAPIERRDRKDPLSISNLVGEVEPDPRSHEAKVSIVMPAFKAEETVGFAIEGILRQSWTNIELIVVDDASRDGTWDIVREHAKSDPRIVPIRQPENRGAYAARNTGLQAATGRFVTINDADDWSHPERIALQAKAALDDGVANATYGARVLSDLQLNRVGRYLPLLILNLSSILYERRTALELNGWDLTRFAADSEFRHRYAQHVGTVHRDLLTDTPMAWLLADENSLTQSSVTGLRSLQFGARQQYREAYRDWHAKASSLCLGETRPFPVPRIALKKNPDPIVCDELLISDFCKKTSVDEELRVIEQALAQQRRIALLHLPRLRHFNRPIDNRVRHLIHEHAIPVTVPGENVTSTTTTLLDSRGLEYLPTPKTSVATKTAYISTANFAKLSSNLGETVAKERIIDVVNKEPEIVGDGGRAP